MAERGQWWIILVMTLLALGCASQSQSLSMVMPGPVVPGEVISFGTGWYYLPDSAPNGQVIPLIVVLHPMGTPAGTYLSSGEWRALAEEYGFLLCAVESNSFYWDETTNDPLRVISSIQFMQKHFPVRADKICLVGFSSGATFANTMTLYNRKTLKGPLIDAFVSFSGDSGFEMDGHIHRGTLDGVIRIPGYLFWGSREDALPGQKMSRFFISQGWDIETWVHPGRHYIPEGGLVRAFDWLNRKIP